jgi:hypothetical protein
LECNTNATATTKPTNTTMVTDVVGLLNMYEYTMSYTGATYQTGYLNNGLYWWTLTPYSASYVRNVYDMVARATIVLPSRAGCAHL